jgi:hypothetical protein
MDLTPTYALNDCNHQKHLSYFEIRAVVKNMFVLEPIVRAGQGLSLFELGQFPSPLVGGIMH